DVPLRAALGGASPALGREPDPRGRQGVPRARAAGARRDARRAVPAGRGERGAPSPARGQDHRLCRTGGSRLDSRACFERSELLSVPGSVGSNYNSWDPAVAVGADGTVYAVFMLTRASQWYPVVAASFDHGRTFTQVTRLIPPDPHNWGDRPFIAVGPDNSVY